MIDYDLMVEKETMEDVILYLVFSRKNGMPHPSMDRFFCLHNAENKYEAYNLKLIEETEKLLASGSLVLGYKKGPNWKEPKFVTEKRYGIE